MTCHLIINKIIAINETNFLVYVYIIFIILTLSHVLSTL